jgi:hypothetical protein
MSEQLDIIKRRLEYLHGQIRLARLLWNSQSPTVVTIQSQIDLRLHPLYLPNFIHDFHRRMDGRELTDVNWQRIDVRNRGVDNFQSVKCTQKAEIMGVVRGKKEAAIFSAVTRFKVKFWWPLASSGDSKHCVHCDVWLSLVLNIVLQIVSFLTSPWASQAARIKTDICLDTAWQLLCSGIRKKREHTV